jgi:hypothetical protein
VPLCAQSVLAHVAGSSADVLGEGVAVLDPPGAVDEMHVRVVHARDRGRILGVVVRPDAGRTHVAPRRHDEDRLRRVDRAQVVQERDVRLKEPSADISDFEEGAHVGESGAVVVEVIIVRAEVDEDMRGLSLVRAEVPGRRHVVVQVHVRAVLCLRITNDESVRRHHIDV